MNELMGYVKEFNKQQKERTNRQPFGLEVSKP